MHTLINEYVSIGLGSKVWHFSNLFGTKEHPTKIGNNTQIGSFSEIKQGVTIGDNCRFQSYVFVSEYTQIGNFVFVGPKAAFFNGKYPSAHKIINKISNPLTPAKIADHVTIGGGALIGPGVEIGTGAVIGMGAVVIENVAKNTIVVGNPAQIIGLTTDKKYSDYFNRALTQG